MDFLKEILGEELFNQFVSKINEHNGNEANADKKIKIANLETGEYVGKGKYDALEAQLTGKQTELDTANNLIAELQKGTKGNEELQGKITGYENQVAQLQAERAELEIKYAFDALLRDSGVDDRDSREFLMFKYEKQLKEQNRTLELDENKHIKGEADIVTALKTSNPTQFKGAVKDKFDPIPLPHNDPRKNEPKDLAAAIKESYEAN